jgi:hypothetical protein
MKDCFQTDFPLGRPGVCILLLFELVLPISESTYYYYSVSLKKRFSFFAKSLLL